MHQATFSVTSNCNFWNMSGSLGLHLKRHTSLASCLGCAASSKTPLTPSVSCMILFHLGTIFCCYDDIGSGDHHACTFRLHTSTKLGFSGTLGKFMRLDASKFCNAQNFGDAPKT